MPTVRLSGRCSTLYRTALDPEKFVAESGYQTESGKHMLLESVLGYRRQQLMWKKEREELALRQEHARILDSLPAFPTTRGPANSRNCHEIGSLNGETKPRYSDRLSSKKREGQDFTFDVNIHSLFLEQVVHAVQPLVDFSIAHLPVYIGTSNWPERLSPKDSLSDLHGEHMSVYEKADVKVIVNRQRLDILSVKPNTNYSPMVRKRSTKTPPATTPVAAASSRPSNAITAPTKLERLMEKRQEKRSASHDSFDLPACLPEPPLLSPSPSLDSDEEKIDMSIDIVHEVIEKDGPIPKKLKTSSASRGDHTPLYAFILRLLAEGRYNLVHWTGKAVGEFRIKDSSGLAKLWGEYRGNKVMNYDKMARALRYYYDGSAPILISVLGRSLTYRFSHDKNMRIQGHLWSDLQIPGRVQMPTRILRSRHDSSGQPRRKKTPVASPAGSEEASSSATGSGSEGSF